MFWRSKKNRLHNLNIINELIETSHNIADSLYSDLTSKYSDFDISDKERWGRNLFLTCIGTTLYNNSNAFSGDGLKKALWILSERLYEDAFYYINEYLKYLSNLSFKTDISGDKISEYIASWLYMNVREVEDYIQEETPPYMFAGNLIYVVFSNILDKENVAMK